MRRFCGLLLAAVLAGTTAFSLAAAGLFGQLVPAAAASENHVYSTAQSAAAGEAAHVPILIENNTGSSASISTSRMTPTS